MSYEVDEDVLQQLDAAMRDPAAPLGGGTGRVVDWREVARWAEAAKD